jgi:hypothetical protein
VQDSAWTPSQCGELDHTKNISVSHHCLTLLPSSCDAVAPHISAITPAPINNLLMHHFLMYFSHMISQFVFPRERPPSHYITPLTAAHLAPEYRPITRVCAVIVPAEIVPPSECLRLASGARAFEDIIERSGLMGDDSNYSALLHLCWKCWFSWYNKDGLVFKP